MSLFQHYRLYSPVRLSLSWWSTALWQPSDIVFLQEKGSWLCMMGNKIRLWKLVFRRESRGTWLINILQHHGGISESKYIAVKLKNMFLDREVYFLFIFSKTCNFMIKSNNDLHFLHKDKIILPYVFLDLFRTRSKSCISFWEIRMFHLKGYVAPISGPEGTWENRLLNNSMFIYKNFLLI